MRKQPLVFVALAFVTLLSSACHRHRDRDRGARQPNDVANNTSAPATDPPPPDPNAANTTATGDGSFTCPGGSVVQGEGCACPAGTSWIANQCQSCPGGSVAQGDACVCPGGTAWTGDACQQVAVATPAPAQPPAPTERPRPSKRSAWIPRPPEPPAPPNVQVNIPVVVGNVTNNMIQQPSQGGGAGPSTPVQSPGPSSPPSRGGSVPPNTKVTVAECRNGMVRGPNGISCQCPQGQEWGGSQCVVTCHPTQVRNGNTCTCPANTRWNNNRCELWQECKPGEVRMGATCLPASMTKKR